MSVYGYHVEKSKEEDSLFVPACDINSFISCTSVIASEYSHLLSYFEIVERGSDLDVPNILLGKCECI